MTKQDLEKQSRYSKVDQRDYWLEDLQEEDFLSADVRCLIKVTLLPPGLCLSMTTSV